MDGSTTSISVDPRQQLDDIVDFVNDSWLASTDFDGPTFLWNHMISDASAQDDDNRNNVPVAAPNEVADVIGLTMQWYFDSISSTVPTAERTEDGVSMPRNDMPTFRIDSQALSGVDAVVGNALMSTRWVNATTNLAKSVEMTARFVGNAADRDGEGFDYLKELIQNVRVYMDSVARNADPQDGEKALRLITRVACNEDFQLNATQMVELLSCGLSFAQWDDTRMFAYDALNSALDTMDRFAKEAKIDEDGRCDGETAHDDGIIAAEAATGSTADASELIKRTVALSVHQQFEESIMFLRHDLMRVSGDEADADRFLVSHHESEAMADAYAARLIAAERWDELIGFIDMVERDRPNQYTVMFPEDLVAYEWESLREAAFEALERWDELRAMYRERIVEAYDPSDLHTIAQLRAISGRDWAGQVRSIVTAYDDGSGRYARNPIYERLLVDERLSAEAERYCRTFPDARADLAAVL